NPISRPSSLIPRRGRPERNAERIARPRSSDCEYAFRRPATACSGIVFRLVEQHLDKQTSPVVRSAAPPPNQSDRGGVVADETGRTEGRGISRRELLKRAGVGAGGLALSGSLAGPAWARPLGSTRSAANTVKLGFVSPLTGPAAGFGEGDPYCIGLAKAAFAKGVTVAGQKYDVEIVSKDRQSTPSRAAQV